MAKIQRFEDIEAWQKARILTSEIYSVSSMAAFSRDFSLIDQLRRASVSIMANIAEGFGRRTDKEFANFLNMAHGSAAEVQCHLYIAHDQGYISKADFERLHVDCDEISRMLQGFMKHLRS